jgi:formate dehydrogenase maturation protein FdhE
MEFQVNLLLGLKVEKFDPNQETCTTSIIQIQYCKSCMTFIKFLDMSSSFQVEIP